jgi:hypothetical protein
MAEKVQALIEAADEERAAAEALLEPPSPHGTDASGARFTATQVLGTLKDVCSASHHTHACMSQDLQ